MSAANPNPMAKSMVSVLVVANTGGGSPLLCGVRWVVKRGERHGGAARRLAKRREDGERGAKGRGNDGLEMMSSGGNKGGKIAKHDRGREEERGEPGKVAPMQAGHLDKMMHG
jgi:hypothetical protein